MLPWTRAMADELSRAPATLRSARMVLTELARLPAQLDALITTLDRTNETIAELHTNLSAFTAGTAARMDHLDAVVSDLTGTLTTIIGAIPGARRALGRQA